MCETQKLPQARLYLNAAQLGIDELVKGKLIGRPFHFYMIGILASLRAVQHALLNHDKYISPAHGQVIDAWRKSTTRDGPELSFIASARNLILKEGAFDAYATRTESSNGEGCNYTVTAEDYDLVYYDGLERRDLLADLRGAVAWCERELADIEAKLP